MVISRSGPYPFTRRYISTAMGLVCGSCLSVTVPFTHSSHRPHLVVQSPTAPLFTALQTQLCSKSCRRKRVLSKTKSCLRELGHSPSTRPFRISFPILIRRLFPAYGYSAMSMAGAFMSASSRVSRSPCLLLSSPHLIWSSRVRPIRPLRLSKVNRTSRRLLPIISLIKSNRLQSASL